MQIGEVSSDAELVVQILEGDNDAFDWLCSRHKTRLFSYAFKRTRNHEDAKDIVQETFFEIWQHLSELKDPKMFANWMFGIASRLIARRYRERQRQIQCISLHR